MSRGKKIRIGVVLFLALLLIAAVCMKCRKTTTVTAQVGVIEDSFHAEGILVWTEKMVDGTQNGNLETLCSHGTRVAKGTHVATVHTGEVDEEVQRKLSAVNERIAEIEKRNSSVILFSEDATKLESMVGERSREIIEATNAGDYARVQILREDINSILDKKASIGGATDNDITLEKLHAEKAEYERMLSGSITEVYAPMAGMFSTRVDGYEALLSPDGIPSLTMTDYQTLKESTPSTDGIPPCKIVDTYMWYFVTSVSEETASALKPGDRVLIRNALTGNEPVEAQIHTVGNAENGKCLISVKSTYDISNVVNSRNQEFDIIKHRYEGFKLPTKALRVVDGKQGVYIRKESGDEFKPIEILYKGNEYMIVRVNPKEGASVTLYDEVVVEK